MDVNHQHIRVSLKNVIGPIAMVDIKIHDAHLQRGCRSFNLHVLAFVASACPTSRNPCLSILYAKTNLLKSEVLLCKASGNGNVVEKAETHGFFGCSMVSRGSTEGEPW